MFFLYDMPSLGTTIMIRTALLTQSFKPGIGALNRYLMLVSLVPWYCILLEVFWGKNHFEGQQSMRGLHTSCEDCLYWLAGYLGALFPESFQSHMSCCSFPHLDWRCPDILNDISMLLYFIEARESMPLMTSINFPPTSRGSIGVIFSWQFSWSSSRSSSKANSPTCSIQLSTEPTADAGRPRLLAMSFLNVAANRRR